jgi:RiboL-PSP-HEPN
VPSQARGDFNDNYADIARLIEIHEELAGTGPGYKHGVEVLNKSAVVLTSAVWEAFCEDLATEAVNHLVAKLSDPKKLPKALRKRIAAELENDVNELAVWDLAMNGWKTVLTSRAQTIADERARALNTPKTKNIAELFEDAVGLTKVTSAWSWKGMSADQAGEKLDRLVTLRGDIAHRSKAADKIKKSAAKDFMEHVGRLVESTDNYVNNEVEKICGNPLF